MAGGKPLLAACGGDTVKIFDISVENGDPCNFQYSPSPGFQVNCLKWNHTNLVVASAGDDKKISLWRTNGQSMGVLPHSGVDVPDNIDESIEGICFSKGSRYLCSGGTGKVVRVWDLQRKRCIKWLRGHTDTITGLAYNCKDEYLASISVNGNLLLHNLASATRATDFKDPHEQVLRVLDYSRTSRHLIVTAGDDGSVHLWDTTGHCPKVSWTKQHSAPTTGVCFFPNNDKMILSVGLDKKLHILDPTFKKPVHSIACEAPFTSLAVKDDGFILAAGTNNGRVMFYDVRGKPHACTILRAYGTHEAVTSLCWQRSNPAFVNVDNCTVEVALLGDSGEDCILMPDPLPTSTSTFHVSTSMISNHLSGQTGISTSDNSPISVSGISAVSNGFCSLSGEHTPAGNQLRAGGVISRFSASNSDFSFKDDMDVFSPLVDVQPITPLPMDSHGDNNKEVVVNESYKKLLFSPSPLSTDRRLPSIKELKSDPLLNFEYKSVAKQDDALPRYSSLQLPSPLVSKSSTYERSPSLTPPEAWGGDPPTERFGPKNKLSRFAPSAHLDTDELLSGSVSSRLQDLSSSSVSATLCFPAKSSSNVSSAKVVDVDFSRSGNSPVISEPLTTHNMNNITSFLGSKVFAGQINADMSGFALPGLSRKYMEYTERRASNILSRDFSFAGDGALLNAESPREKKIGLEKEEQRSAASELNEKRFSENNSFLRADTLVPPLSSSFPANGSSQSNQSSSLIHSDPNYQGPPSFALQLVQRTLEESLGNVQKAIHEDVQNLHLELLRQFHIQQTEMSTFMQSMLSRQEELMKEVQALRRENHQLHQLL